MTLPRAQQQVAAVIVTYQPDPALLVRLLAAVQPQVAAVVVVDNGSERDLAQLLSGLPVTLLRQEENLGLAAGFNLGIAWGEQHGFDQVLLLDQDSIPADDMVAQLQAALHKLMVQGEAVAAVGPVARDPATGREAGFARLGPLRFRFVRSEDAALPVPADFLISSGSLVPLATVQRVGWMDAGIFIDLVDTEWFLRARAAGFRAYGVPTALLHHGIGERTAAVAIAGRPVGSLHCHGPVRHYYIFRNSVLLSRRPYVPWRWVLNNLVQLVGMFVYFSLVPSSRWQHLCMMLRGVGDGLRGRQGKCP
jgi:rhamnosyltransferase